MFVKLALCLAVALNVAKAGITEMPEWYAQALANKEIKMPEDKPRAGPFDVCVTSKLRGCQNKFNTQLGINGNLDWTDPFVLTYAINKVFRSGTEGYAEVCNARNTFQGCLGASYFACLEPTYFARQGYNQTLAYDYLSIFLGLEFDCIQGFTVGIRDWQCIGNTARLPASATTVELCVTAFRTAIKQGMNICETTTTLTQCVSKVYRKGCPPGYGREAGWWICKEILRSFIIPQTCNIDCPIID
jgi:hypothetical protein